MTGMRHDADDRAGRTVGHGASRRPTALTVRLLARHDVAAAAAVLARAFAEEPGKRALFDEGSAPWALFADPGARTGLAEATADGRLRAALPYAAVHVADVDGTIAGVALADAERTPPKVLMALGSPRTHGAPCREGPPGTAWSQRRPARGW